MLQLCIVHHDFNKHQLIVSVVVVLVAAVVVVIFVCIPFFYVSWVFDDWFLCHKNSDTVCEIVRDRPTFFKRKRMVERMRQNVEN